MNVSTSDNAALAALLRSWLRPDEAPATTEKHTSSSHLPLPASYAGSDGEHPGEFPYKRGISARMYHDELWVMGMYSGYASPRETNARFRTLLEAGQTGLSIALDLPTQIGIDSDDPLAEGEVGKVGVPINSVEDILTLFDGLPLQQVRQIRSTCNAIGPIFAAFVIVALEELGIKPTTFRLFLQNDPLKEFSSRGTWIFPPEQSTRFAVDVIEYFAKHYPSWQPIQFCGYHIRDVGGTAIQEVAVATANGIAYLDEARRRGVEIAAIADSLFLFLSSSIDIFEEAAKFRAARSLWARLLNERYSVPKEKAAIKIFSYTLGGALTAREPQNNIVRVAFEALGAILGGVQTLATSSWDEAHSLPSEEAAHLALRTQQILAVETGVTKVADPLGGSYYVEALTRRLENEITRYTVELLDQGGAIKVIESGFLTRELADSAFREYQEVARGERQVVGVNFKPSNQPIPATMPFVAPSGTTQEAISGLNHVRKNRDAARFQAALESLRVDAREGRNTMPALIEAARARATIGEITAALASVFGRNTSSIEYGVPVEHEA
jgi:methylmalonyl-CoA mutase, N-terminal domain